MHAGPVLGRLDPEGRVSALQRVPPLPWQVWELRADELAAANLADGAPALFAVEADELHYTWKPSPSAPWAEGTARRAGERRDADADPGGGLAAFGITGGEVRHCWQDRPAERWGEWTRLGTPGAP